MVDHRKGCCRLVAHWRVRFDYRKACRRLAVVWRVCLDCHYACIGLVEVGWCFLSTVKCVGCLYRLGVF